MPKLKNCFLILAFLCGLYTVAPARASNAPATIGSAPRFSHLTREQGLSHNTVRCILQDSQGFMWFGTQDGLNKYDGYTFTVYRHRRSDPDSLANNTVTALYQDHTGVLWIGTTGGLDSFAGDAPRFTHHPTVSEEVAAIYEDASGALWIGTSGSGLFRRDPASGEFIHYKYDPADPHGLSDNNVTTILEDDSGTLWLGTADGGLDVLERAGGRFSSYRHDPADPSSLSHDRVTALYQDHAGVLWVGTGTDYEVALGGLNVFVPGQGDLDAGRFDHYLHAPGEPHSLSNNHVKAIYEDQAGALWIGTDDGLNVFDRATNTFSSYHHDPVDPHSLSSGAITAIYEDRAGVLWVGTDDEGVNKYTRVKEKFARYQSDPLDPQGLSDAEVSALYEDHSGVLWIGVAGEGLDSLDRKTGQYTHYTHDPDDPYSLSNNNVRALYQDHQGVLWVGTSRGLDRHRAAGQFDRFAHTPDDPGSLSQGAVKAILEDQTHTLWVATEEPGSLNRFDRATGTFTRYENDPHDSGSFINTYGVRAIYEDRAGDLWLGTYNGLVHFDRASEVFTQYWHNPADPFSLSHNFVWSIYEAPDGILWVATAGGLNRFDRSSGRFSVYTMENGLANDNVMCMLADAQGNLWLGTGGGGLSRFDPRAETWRNYDTSDGLTGDDFQLGSCHQSKSGEMFFGTFDGFNAFYPADVQDNPFIPPIVLTAFRKFDEVVEFDAPLADVTQITLSHDDNFFAFEFAALDYTDPARNQYAYKLEGFDKDWVACGARRYAGYTGVPPGQYTFRVKGANNDGLWNKEGRAIKIVITPPFWETWWFRALAFAVLFGLVFCVVRARMQNVAVLRASEERFRMLFENAPLCVFELDMATTPRIMRANRRSERVYGWSPAEFAAIALQSMFSPDARPALEQMLNALDAGKTVTIESTGLRRDGTAFPVRVSATGEPGPDLRLAILAIEDITAEKERRSEEEAIAEERRRIAREIHDGLAQDLAGLRFRVGLWHKLVDDAPGQMHAELDGLRALLSQKIREVRRSIFALRPVALDELGFFPAIRQFTAEFGEQNQLHVDLRVEGPEERLPAFLEPVLFRIIQESLNNVSKHAQANMVWIALALDVPDAVTLHVRDNGAGFDSAMLTQIVQRGHLGLKQMRERVENFKGVFELHSQPGGGTEIKIILPLAAQSHIN